MEPIKCFMLERTSKCRRYLRRYATTSEKCPSSEGWAYHNAEVRIEDGTVEFDERGTYAASEEAAPDEKRWPVACACGYVFGPDDQSMLKRELIYRRADTDEEMTLDDAPAGAMYNAPWMSISRTYDGTPGKFIGPDGMCLELKLPDGHYWCIDGPANNGPGWVRTGTPPNITARPSILSHEGGFHGWLTDGVLTEV